MYRSYFKCFAALTSVIECYLRFQHRNVITQSDHHDLSLPLDCFIKAAVFDAVRLVVNVVVVVFVHPIILSFQTRLICPQFRSESSCGVVTLLPPHDGTNRAQMRDTAPASIILLTNYQTRSKHEIQSFSGVSN